MKIYLLLLVLTLCFPTITLAEKSNDLRIENHEVIIELCQKREPDLRWYLKILRKQKDSKNAYLIFQATLVGSFKDTSFAESFRKKYNVYYPFQKVEKLEKIGIEKLAFSQHIKFRISVYNQFWLDSKITIFKNSAFVLFECTGKSHSALTPHWAITFHKGPLFELITEAQINAGNSISIKAKKLKGNHIYKHITKYCIIFRKNNIFFPVIMPLPNQHIDLMVYRKNGMKSFWLNAPFVLYSDIGNFKKDAHTMGHIGEGLVSQLKIIMNKYSNENNKRTHK